MQEISQALKRFRKTYKITQKQAALIANITERNYQDYEYAKTSPSVLPLVILAKHFNVSLDYLVGLSDDPARH